jgi:5-enolpyruvylshikimate-3-phosphate synthase
VEVPGDKSISHRAALLGGLAQGVTEVHVSSGGDHRLAMALAIAGLAAEGETVVDDTACIETSFPRFADTINALTGEPSLVSEA